MRDWLVAGAVIEGTGTDAGSLLLVRNRRRDGSLDWSPPGGVIEDGEAVLDGLTREVVEETGLTVTAWDGPLYVVTIHAPGLGWRLRVEAFLALEVTGALGPCDPDGIVECAEFVAAADHAGRLDGASPWVRDPINEWLTDRWVGERTFAYDVTGTDRAAAVVTRR